ncbi:hypothetical protein [Devosia sp.]|uniref:hypothetical protein n=1 Tax=Devosia sp. TaxID=1871048 RepID=UPI003BABFB7F
MQFSKGARPTRPRPEGDATAEVVLFTGVRYERAGNTRPDKPAGAASGGKRRRG